MPPGNNQALCKCKEEFYVRTNLVDGNYIACTVNLKPSTTPQQPGFFNSQYSQVLFANGMYTLFMLDAEHQNSVINARLDNASYWSDDCGLPADEYSFNLLAVQGVTTWEVPFHTEATKCRTMNFGAYQAATLYVVTGYKPGFSSDPRGPWSEFFRFESDQTIFGVSIIANTYPLMNPPVGTEGYNNASVYCPNSATASNTTSECVSHCLLWLT